MQPLSGARRKVRIVNDAFDERPLPCWCFRQVFKSVGEVNDINTAILQGRDECAVLLPGTPGPQHLAEQMFVVGIRGDPLDFCSGLVNQNLSQWVAFRKHLC